MTPFKRLIFIIIYIFVAIPYLIAQSDAQADTAKIKSLAISLTDVPASIEAVKVEMLDVKRDIRVDRNIQEIRDTLSGFELYFNAQTRQLDSSQLNQMNLDQLLSTENDAKFVQNQVDEWNSILLNRVTKLNGFQVQILNKLNIWSKTREEAISNEAPEAIIESIDLVLTELTSLQDSLLLPFQSLRKYYP